MPIHIIFSFLTSNSHSLEKKLENGCIYSSFTSENIPEQNGNKSVSIAAIFDRDLNALNAL